MKLSTVRSLEDLQSVLEDPQDLVNETEYWVFTEISNSSWANLTVITPKRVGDEYPKTFGHYHPNESPIEIYHLISGTGVLVLQKRDLSEIFLVKVQPGQQIKIPKEYGHSWSNVGSEPLISYDDWRIGHTDTDYAEIRSLHGMAYYLIDDNGKVKVVKNSHYNQIPEAIWLTVEEFNLKTNSS